MDLSYHHEIATVNEGGIMSGLIFLLLIVFLPVLWQIPRTFWPVRLNSSGTNFTGLYRRYSVESVTGYASHVRESESTRTIGSVKAQTSGTTIANYTSATTTVHDNRRTFTTYHVSFLITDQNGNTTELDSANAGTSVHDGDLVSAARLKHNGKLGNAFLVYNHTTNMVYVEMSRRGLDKARHGIVNMIFKLPTAYVVILCFGIVTIPLIALLGVGAQVHVRGFRKRGIGPLKSALELRAAEFPSPQLSNSEPPAVAVHDDLASQVKDIAALHESGVLSAEEFQAAKAKLLGT